jgi:hypothetical protein
MDLICARYARWVMLLSATACGGAGTPGGDGGTASDGGAASDGGTASVELTLDNCATNIASDVPAFFRTYFRCVTITKSGTDIVIQTKGLPPHRTFYYGVSSPNYATFDRSGGRAPNPNTLREQNVTMTIPSNPVSRGLTITTAMVDRTANTNTNEYSGGAVGVALDSVLLFNDQAAPGDNIDNEAFTFDGYNAHPQQQGQYHYHTSTPGPLEVLQKIGATSSTTPGSASVELYGILCDGTLVLGCTELDGSQPSGGDFDGQNGHTHDIRDGTATHFVSRYHTHVCPTRFTTHKYTPEIRYYTTCTMTGR